MFHKHTIIIINFTNIIIWYLKYFNEYIMISQISSTIIYHVTNILSVISDIQDIMKYLLNII